MVLWGALGYYIAHTVPSLTTYVNALSSDAKHKKTPRHGRQGFFYLRGIDSLLPPILGERAAFSKLCTGISGGHYRRLPAPVLLHLYHACARRRVRLRSAYAEGMPGYPARFDIFDVPLDDQECYWMAKSVCKISRKNLASGQTQQNFSFIQAAKGRRSGEVRRKGSVEEAAPWEAEGISRATWYYRQAGRHAGSHGDVRRFLPS